MFDSPQHSLPALSPFVFQLSVRRSVSPKHLINPAPDEGTLRAAAIAARSAPSHTEPFPVRFVVIDDREKLAQLFSAALPINASAEERAKAENKAKKGPMQIAVIVRRSTTDSKRDELENAMTAGAALVNFLHVLNDAGFAAKTVSGRNFNAPKGLYDPITEMLAAFIICGTPEETISKAPKAIRTIPEELLTSW